MRRPIQTVELTQEPSFEPPRLDSVCTGLSLSIDHIELPENLPFSSSDIGLLKKRLATALVSPAQSMLSRPSKGFRGLAVALAYDLCEPHPVDIEFSAKQLAAIEDALEKLHAGSLIIDDIEDGSSSRRGKPALHLEHGVPLALNVGNWLYFWPLQALASLRLSPAQELQVYRLMSETLAFAHYGQAIDLSSDVLLMRSDEIAVACASSLYLKSGMLMGLGMQLGAVLAEAATERQSLLAQVGREIGTGLQMFDDIGSLYLPEDDPKRFEDLRLHRPSWIWKIAAESSDPGELDRLKQVVLRLPSADSLNEWLEISSVPKQAVEKAHMHMQENLTLLQDHLDEHGAGPRAMRAFADLERLVERITHAYF